MDQSLVWVTKPVILNVELLVSAKFGKVWWNVWSGGLGRRKAERLGLMLFRGGGGPNKSSTGGNHWWQVESC